MKISICFFWKLKKQQAEGTFVKHKLVSSILDDITTVTGTDTDKKRQWNETVAERDIHKSALIWKLLKNQHWFANQGVNTLCVKNYLELWILSLFYFKYVSGKYWVGWFCTEYFNQTFPPDHNKLKTPTWNPPPHPYITENLLIEK